MSSATATTEPSKHVKVFVHTAGPRAAASAAAATAHKLGKNILGVREVESTTPATTSRCEVESPGTPAAAGGHAAKALEAAKVGHTASASVGILSGLWRRRTAAKEEFEAILVVNLAFLGIREDLVGLGAILEFFGGLRIVFVLVGMILQSCLPVRGVRLAYRYRR